MKALIDVFRMDELSSETKIKLIKSLGRALSYQYACNEVQDLVDELVAAINVKSIQTQTHTLVCLECGSLTVGYKNLSDVTGCHDFPSPTPDGR